MIPQQGWDAGQQPIPFETRLLWYHLQAVRPRQPASGGGGLCGGTWARQFSELRHLLPGKAPGFHLQKRDVKAISRDTGHGDLPTNGEEFYDELKIADINLREMKYGVLALGDSSHKHFCGAGKKVDARFEQLGANKIIDRLECDGGTDGSIEWSNKFLETIKKYD